MKAHPSFEFVSIKGGLNVWDSCQICCLDAGLLSYAPSRLALTCQLNVSIINALHVLHTPPLNLKSR